MKLLKRLFIVPCCAALLLTAGCNNKTYGVYTNMPEGSFQIADKNYVLADNIGGYSSPSRQFEEIDTSAYTSKHEYLYAMSADAEMVVGADFTADGATAAYDKFLWAVKAKLYEIEKSLSSTVTGSDIYNFNNSPAGARLEVTQITYDVLSEAKSVYDLTDCCYNPALYYNIQAYGFGGSYKNFTDASQLPADGDVAKYTDLASHFGEIVLERIDGEEGEKTEYYVTKPEYTVEVGGETLSMKLDLGGIGKGYAVDCVDVLFDEYGYKFGYFNFASSSMLFKSHYTAGAYNLGFSGARSPSREPYLTTTVRDEKLSSSGDYEQYYIIDGTRYCHVISPKTGKPVQTGIMSVTVIGGSAATDDALTTAIMAMEKDEAVKFIGEKLTDRKVAFTLE